jgi:hypothetical protein
LKNGKSFSARANGCRGNGNGAIRLSQNGLGDWAANSRFPVADIAAMAATAMAPIFRCHNPRNRSDHAVRSVDITFFLARHIMPITARIGAIKMSIFYSDHWHLQMGRNPSVLFQ